jgi:HlyD family secretion protein
MSTTDDHPETVAPGHPYDPRHEDGSEARPPGRLLKVALAVVALAVVAGVAYSLVRPASDAEGAEAVETAAVRRRPLTVTVTEGGTLVATESTEVKSDVEGHRTILEIVEEGTVITPEDVEEGMVLVQLDSSELEERLSNREISFLDADSNYKQAVENHAIQKKQNESNVALAELNVKFARMELDRYLGSELAAALLEGSAGFEGLAENPALGGVARQTMNTYEANLLLRNEELTRAAESLEWSQKLYEKGYVNRNELTGDELQKKSAEITVDAAQEELRLFKLYTLPKEAEQRFSDYVEADRELERVKARARSQMAQAEANLKSRERSHELEREQLDKAREMVEKCTIVAPEPGRVVYASTANPWRRRHDPIREGERVWQNQEIIEIPDLSSLTARVNLHETDIRKVELGQEATVSVEALPGQAFPGKVTRISPVASSAHAWINPEIKVYETDVALDEVPEGLTPGMTATAEIVVAQLEDVLQVPVEAVTTYGGERVCVVLTAAGPQVRPVETGFFTEKQVEIRSGLELGEQVLLDPGESLGEQYWTLEPQSEEQLRRFAEEHAAQTQEAEQQEQEAPGEQEQEPAEEGAEQMDWATLAPQLRQLQNLPPEEAAKKWQEILDKLTPAQRKQLEETARKWQQGGGQGGGAGQGWGQ